MALFLQISNFILMKMKLFSALCIALLGVVFFSLHTAHAVVDQQDQLGLRYGVESGLGSSDIRFTAAQIINVSLGLLGIIALVLIVYAGFLWMTAGGNSDQIDKAKGILFASVIGLIIILSAYSISRFVITNLFKATTGQEYVE